MAFASPLRCRAALFDGSRTYVVGVLNLTPDSFSDGGKVFARAEAVARGRWLCEQGADIVDIGGESTRPGAAAVAAATEIDRVAPVIEVLARGLAVPISVDTRKGAVAEAALHAGASVVNDVSGGEDPALLAACARAGAALIVGHLRGDPTTMQRDIHFHDVFDEVAAELAARLAAARAAGIESLVADPGLGFGKTTSHNLTLLARLDALSRRLGAPVMVGASRKRFLGELSGLPVEQRLAPSLAAAVAAALRGADFVRAHDVAETRAALAVADAIRRAGGGGEGG